jgi:NaMN:DMB phosphoribosyltransferase
MRIAGERLEQEIAVALDPCLALGLDRERLRLIRGDGFVEIGNVGQQAAQIDLREAWALASGLGAGDSSSALKAARSLSASSMDSWTSSGVRNHCERTSSVVQAGERGAEIVGDVVRDLTHALHQTGDEV